MTPDLSQAKGERPPRIVGSGLVTLDIVLRGTRGAKAADESIAHSAGGTCGNVLAALAFLGWQARPVARLGDDTAAEAIVADLARSGVATDALVREAGARSTRIVQHIDERPKGQVRHRFAFRCPTCGSVFARYRPLRWEQVEILTDQGNAAPDVFFFDRVSPAILRLAEALRKEGTLIYFEPSGIGRLDEFRRALTLAHVVKYSEDRLHAALARLGGIGRVVSARPRVEIETQGASGVRFRVREGSARGRGWHHQPAFRVLRVRDAAGAGDWCSAGLLYQLGWQRGADPAELSADAVAHALTFGQALAALSCQHVGPRSVTHVFGSRDILTSALAVQRDGQTDDPDSSEALRVERVRPRRSECRICLLGQEADLSQ